MAANGQDLSEADRSAIDSEHHRWLDAALSTESCDQQAVEAAVAAVYSTAGLEPTLVSVWTDSPYEGLLACRAIREDLGPRRRWWARRDPRLKHIADGMRLHLETLRAFRARFPVAESARVDIWNRLCTELWDGLENHVGSWDALCNQLGVLLWPGLVAEVQQQLGDRFEDRLANDVGGPGIANLRYQPGVLDYGSIRMSLWGHVGGALDGQVDPWHDSYALAFYRQALRIAQLSSPPALDALIDAVGRAAWWWPMRGVVVFSNRPTSVRQSDDGSYGLVYADGYAVTLPGTLPGTNGKERQ